MRHVYFALQTHWALKHIILAVSLGPGGFRERRETCRISFQPSWYLSDSVATICDYYRVPAKGNLFVHCTLNI